MTTQWEGQGCSVSHKEWETGEQPICLDVGMVRNAYLHQCDVRGVYWEQHERYVDVVFDGGAEDFYPDFSKKGKFKNKSRAHQAGYG